MWIGGMCVKLRKSTIVVIITSWILFFIAAFLAYAKLDQMKQERLTNEKIFQQTTQKNTSQGVKEIKKKSKPKWTSTHWREKQNSH